ncbi:unnamed protein product [Chrysoparadoxa australica]
MRSPATSLGLVLTSMLLSRRALGFTAPCAASLARSRWPLSSSLSDMPFKAPPSEEPVESTFESLGMLDEVTAQVKELGFTRPSPIQKLTIPQALSGDSLVLSAATGTGKTFAYLLPIISMLKAQELSGYQRQNQRPRAVILVPTRELAQQVLHVAKSLSHRVKFSCTGIMGGEDFGRQRKALQGSVDLVIASPGRMLKHRDAGNVFLSHLKHVVVDEVDTMLLQGFAEDINKLFRPLVANEQRKQELQFLFASATLPKAARQMLFEDSFFPKLRVVEAEGMHKSLANMSHVMIDVKGADKMDKLLDVVRQSVSRFQRTMIFCNTVASSQAVEHTLREVDIEGGVRCYHKDVKSQERSKNFDIFRAGDIKTLVCTDIAARGLDLPEVDHVVMFDFPLNSMDYLHRSGRTARMGAAGRVTSLIAKRDKVLAAAIERTVLSGGSLEGLTARKTDYVEGGKLAPVLGRKGQVRPKGNNHRGAKAAAGAGKGKSSASSKRSSNSRGERLWQGNKASAGRGRR